MDIHLTTREFRLLLDLVYIGNWILNSTRPEEDRFREYDNIESKIFGLCRNTGMQSLVECTDLVNYPSLAYTEGGIHEAISFYEDNIFYELLAEELSRRDMNYPEIGEDNYRDLTARIDRYMDEFEQSGVDHLVLED